VRLGINIGLAQLRARGRRQAQVTVSLNADFLSSAKVGDWLEAHVAITRMGQRMAFANCDLRVASKQVLRANARVSPSSTGRCRTGATRAL
jgi:acyl-coenzyme A thioesterase PaaI-like protein